MAISMEGSVAYLQGDLTYSGVTQNIVDSLDVSLQKTEYGIERNINIDCGKILSADISGLQLLYVWMQCARLRGVKSRLVNLSESLQQEMQRMGIRHCFTDSSA